ncbi:hypothetical protein TNCV_2493011 [Trichonephila clavipes]|uniref:RNase H type-1 domain-containing protein n=1 Tax=Trichonephila clavipes TaxID=2585209 RepID=A0A8X6RZ41_TRICX|nr:hypothetical protein TNCV_2493011 [Trichonephila clavipes]
MTLPGIVTIPRVKGMMHAKSMESHFGVVCLFGNCLCQLAILATLPWLTAGWRSWFVSGLLYPRLRLRARPKLVDFPEAVNRQRPCYIIIRCLLLEKKLGVKITSGNWYRLNGAALKSDTSVWGGPQSRAPVQHLSNWTSIGDQTSLDILNLLDCISTNPCVHFQWVLSHVGIDGNEKANFLIRSVVEEGVSSTGSLRIILSQED